MNNHLIQKQKSENWLSREEVIKIKLGKTLHKSLRELP